MAIAGGVPVISYTANLDLCYVRAMDAEGLAWNTPQFLDADGDTGLYTSLAIVQGRPAIAYSRTDVDELYYKAANDEFGLSWSAPELLDSAGNTIAHNELLEVNGNPAVACFPTDVLDLRFVRYQP
jgi:hypothetical protein